MDNSRRLEDQTFRGLSLRVEGIHVQREVDEEVRSMRRGQWTHSCDADKMRCLRRGGWGEQTGGWALTVMSEVQITLPGSHLMLWGRDELNLRGLGFKRPSAQ